MRKMSSWESLIIGAVFALLGLYMGLTNSDWGAWGKFSIPTWGGWIFFLVGAAVCGLSIRALLRGEGKPRPYTDEDAEKAKKELDALYRYDHGRPPEAPEEEKPAGRKPGSA